MLSIDSVAPPQGLSSSTGISQEELQLAARNHGMPLEVLRHPITPAGLHYVLIHYDIPAVDPAAFRLELDGLVERSLSLSLDELRARPRVTQAVTMECAGNGRAQLEPRPISQPWLVEAVGNAEWTGTPLRGLLEEAGIGGDAVDVVFTGLDRGLEGGLEQVYQRALPVEDAMHEEVLLAYEMGGAPLPPQHGFPLRLLVPGWYGMTSVKWLTRITVLTERFEGYQHARAYRLMQSDDDPGTPVSRILPRSLMAPPGIPDFLTRRRFLPLEPCRLEGRAWSGFGSIERVEVSADGGASWHPAELGDQPAPHAWRGWSYVWDPLGPGDYALASRATDSAGNTQPLEAPWNLKGYANNCVQRIPVTVGS